MWLKSSCEGRTKHLSWKTVPSCTVVLGGTGHMSRFAGRCYSFCPFEEPGFRVPWLLCQAWVLQGCSNPSQSLPSGQSPREEGSVATHLSLHSLNAPHRPAAGYPADKAPSMLHPSFWNIRTMTLSQGSGRRAGGVQLAMLRSSLVPGTVLLSPLCQRNGTIFLQPQWPHSLPQSLGFSPSPYSVFPTPSSPFCVMLESWSPRCQSCSATMAADLQWTNHSPQGPVCTSHTKTASSTCPALPDENPTLNRH